MVSEGVYCPFSPFPAQRSPVPLYPSRLPPAGTPALLGRKVAKVELQKDFAPNLAGLGSLFTRSACLDSGGFGKRCEQAK